MRIILFFIGLLLALWSAFFLFALIVGFCLFIFLIFYFRSELFYPTLGLGLACFVAGFLWGEVHFFIRAQETFPSTVEGKNIIVEGRIEGVPAAFEHYQKFQFNVDKIVGIKNWQGKISLFWYKYTNNRLLRKLASAREIGGDSEQTNRQESRFAQELAEGRGPGTARVKTGVYTRVHEDSSTESTNKFSAEVEFPKKSNHRYPITVPHPHEPLLKAGQKWRFTVKLKKPRGYRNPGSFDYDAWLFEQNIAAKGYVVNSANNILLAPPGWHAWIEQVRQGIGAIWQPFAERWPLLGVLLAFTVGLTSTITQEQWQVFTNTGTIHLISISGFHINMIAGMAYGGVNFLWRRIPYFCERWPAQRAAAVGAILMGIIYSLLAGYSIPTQRSLITLSIFMGGILFQRQTNVWQCFWWSIFVVTLLDPFAPLNLSFWLTYSAVAIILYALMDPQTPPLKMPLREKLSSMKGRVVFNLIQLCWPALKLQLQIFIGLIPFSLFWFSQVSVSSLWANFVAIPVTGFLVLPLALWAICLEFIYFPWAVFLMRASHWILEKLYLYLNWISHEHPVIFIWSLNKIWMLLLGIFGIMLLLAPKGWPGRWLGILLWLPLFFPLKNHINYGEVHFSLLDVGQGLASVIQTQNHVLVFDTGPKLSEYFDTGKAVVLPYLRSQHIQKIDALVISHKDLDHSGGLHSLLNNMPINTIWVNDKKILNMANLCEPDVFWEWDGVKFQFLMRGLEQFTDTNDTSCVLKVSNVSHSLLLPGDLEAKAEKVLVQQYGKTLKTDLLIAGHHGSKTSSSQKWLDITKPDYALFATGYLNRYHFPHPAIVMRYEKIGAQHWSTTDCGMIQWTLPVIKEMREPACYLQENMHPWYYTQVT